MDDSFNLWADSNDILSVSRGSQVNSPEAALAMATSSSLTLSNPDIARVFVRLPNGTKFLVPVSQNSTVEELHIQALHRAERLGASGTMENTLLETAGRDPIALFPNDSLIDVMDLTTDNTFTLRSLINPSIQPQLQDGGASTDVSTPTSSRVGPFNFAVPSLFHKEDSMVYIRWITLEAALDNFCLKQIPFDPSPVPSSTTLNALYTTAIDRLCSNSPQSSCNNPTNINLFLWECRLYALNNPATLDDLALTGDRVVPLDIFVEFIGPERRLSINHLSPMTDPNSLWNFDSTKRGISTFITSLQILFKEIDLGNCSLDNTLEMLWGLTHFPPLLLAFKSLHESGLDNDTSTGPLLLVASAFHAICLRMLPSKMCPLSENALEASRQITYWIYSMRHESAILRSSVEKLIHQVEIKEAGEDGQFIPNFLPFRQVIMPLGPGAGPREKTFLVSSEKEDIALCRLLGLAIHENASSPWDLYFHSRSDLKGLVSHRITSLLPPSELGALMANASSMGPFSMVNPLQLGTCLSAELPVITLSATGYVSRYDHEDIGCGERSFITWNAIDKKVKQTGIPGQLLYQELAPILQERKKTSNWELDAWSGLTEAADFGAPDEAIIICVDVSSSMDASMPNIWIPNRASLGTNPSRLTEVKEFFKNQAIRISALNLSTYLGLVTFAGRNRINIDQPLTPLHLDFSNKLDTIYSDGRTAIFDALDIARGMFVDLKQRYPQTKCRIILLTDGWDNDSTILSSTVSSNLYEEDIVLDAIVIGANRFSDLETRDLFKIARHTGGYAFKPLTQQAFFQIFLLETVCDIRTRPDTNRVPGHNWNVLQPKEADMADPYDIPPCRPHPNLEDYFVPLADAERFMNRMSRKSGWSTGSVYSASTILSNASTVTATAGGLSRILLSEIKAMIDNPHEAMDIYVSQSNMGFWKVVMQGPSHSPYQNGTFLLYVEIGLEFPRKPPSARFITPVLHPNITKHGRVCHPIFDREWTPATRVFEVLQQLYGIMMLAEVRDVIDPLSAFRFLSDGAGGLQEVEEYVNRFAQRSRELHREDIIADDVSSTAWSSVNTPSSYVGSVTSNKIAVSPRLPYFLSNTQNQGQNFSGPPSYQTNPSNSARSSITLSSDSTLSRHFANQRNPLHNSPTATNNQGSENAQNPGSDGKGGTPVGSGVSSTGSMVSGGSESGSSVGSASSGRRSSRRANFFGKVRKAGNKK